jgi:peroxiredoxin Q/BCP
MHQRRFVLILALALVASAFAFAADAVPQVGQMAPGFTLPSQDGSSISLKDFKGKWVVLYFYPKDKTRGCTIEAHNFQEDQAKYNQKNAVIVGVSVDTKESHQEFCAEQNLTFKLLSDTDAKVVKSYGSIEDPANMPAQFKSLTLAARNTFLVDPQGKITKVWTKVNPNKHSEEVLEALNEAAKK